MPTISNLPAASSVEGTDGVAVVQDGVTRNAPVSLFSAAVGEGASVTVDDAPPSPADPGDLWWDKVSGQLYILYDDGTSEQWVTASPTSAEVTGPWMITATGGTTARSAQDRASDNGYSVLEAGAVGDWNWDTMTGTNDRAAIQALLDNPPVGKRITFPAGRQFYVGTGLVLEANANLFLSGTDFSGIAYPPTTSGLVCDADCDCLTINGPAGAVIENLTFSSKATVQPTEGAGIRAMGGRRVTLHRTLCYNNYEAYRFQGVDGVGGLGGYMIEPYAAKVVRAYIVQHTWAELYISGGGRIGNGPDWTTPEAHISIEGGSTTNAGAGPNSLYVSGVQIQSAAGPVSFIQMVNRTTDALITGITAIGIHGSVMESGSPGMTNIFYADSSWSFLQRFSMTGMYINAGTAEFWNVPAAFQLFAVTLVANQLLNCMTFTLDQTAQYHLTMGCQQLDADVSLTSNSSSSAVSLVGMEIVGNVTLDGVWRGLDIIGGTITGTLTNTATGGVNILVPNQTNALANDLNIGGNTVASQVDLRLNSEAGVVRTLHFQSAGVDRMTFGLTAGDNVALNTYDIAGTLLGTALSVSTTTGIPTFPMGINQPILTLGTDAQASATELRLNAASGQVKTMRFKSGGLDRMTFGLSAGNNGALAMYDAAGVTTGTAMTINAATGLPSFPTGVAVTRTAPASAGATGVVGEVAFDTGYIYICTATDTWKRVAIATW